MCRPLSKWVIVKANCKGLAGEEGKNKGKKKEKEGYDENLNSSENGKLKNKKSKFCRKCFKIGGGGGRNFAKNGLKRPIWRGHRHIYIYVYVYVYIYTYMYTYIHIHVTRVCVCEKGRALRTAIPEVIVRAARVQNETAPEKL